VNNTVKFSLAGAVLLVALRMAIGWQLLYEGLWKIDSLSTASPWTAEGYLRNAQGPMRNTFRGMTGDPDDFGWLDADRVAARWDQWYAHFVSHYNLTDVQQRDLALKLTGPADFRAELKSLPEGVTVERFNSTVKSVRYDPKAQRLICDGQQHLLPAEKRRLLALATGETPVDAVYRRAVEDLYKRASRLSFKDRLRASLQGDPERAGVTIEEYKGTDEYHRVGEIELYKAQVQRYEQNLARAKQDFNYAHLNQQYQELQQLRSAAIGPIKALDRELKEEAGKLLTTGQLALGPVSLPRTPIDWINLQTIAGLTVLGFLLIAGLFTRFAAVAGALMLTMFYLAMPPWPGVPEAPGPEHSFIINKNLIEVIALLAIAALPTGRWFGLDSLLCRCCRRCRPAEQAASAPAK